MSHSIVKEKKDRVIGLVEGREAGATVVVIGSMHGNEPAGAQALKEVVDKLETENAFTKGRFLALRGNLQALERGVRYIDEDMNRIWYPAIIDEIRQTPSRQLASSERREIKGLLDIIDDFLPENPKLSSHPVVIGDLHSFSAEGAMFGITAQNPTHIELFSKLHIPLVFGIEKTLRGSALRYYQDYGGITFVVEGGQHEDKKAIKKNAATMLVLLHKIGCINPAYVPDFNRYEHFLAKQNKALPPQVKYVYQHEIEPHDEFNMRPGFVNFQPVKEGEWLASDKSGKIVAHCDGYILMPLYQKQGSDGFFIVQEAGSRRYKV